MDTQTRRQRAAIVAALTALLLIGGLMARAAGAGTSHAPQAPVGHVSRAVAGVRAADAPTATVGATPTATATQAPSPTAGSTPTATATTAPTSTPTATATPAPTWHTVASYSGSAPETLPSFTAPGQWRVEWTCTPGASPGWSFAMSWTGDGNGVGGMGTNCTTSGGVTSGTATACVAGSTSCDGRYSSWVVSVESCLCSPEPTIPPTGAWTVVIEVYS